MIEALRRIGRVAIVAIGLPGLAACATTGDDVASAGQQVAPVQDSAVDSSSLPPIGGTDGSVQVASATPDEATDAQATRSDASDPTLAANGGGGQPVDGTTTGSTGGTTPPATQSSFVSLSDYGAAADGAGTGRNLTGALTVDKLLGGWTVSSGDTSCRLNLTYTAADSTSGRYRASAPACQIQALAAVSSWQLSGTQVQLFNDANQLVGALLLTGDRFIGTLSGGQAVTMVG